ncbi:hypothetical protein G9A89_001725 [Geosiphon pyriformis]|nr:hypothetical protein G9A89_001725 [Geosiphon pyriformis]
MLASLKVECLKMIAENFNVHLRGLYSHETMETSPTSFKKVPILELINRPAAKCLEMVEYETAVPLFIGLGIFVALRISLVGCTPVIPEV